VSMGRTLVLPPKMQFYLLWHGGEKHKNVIGFADFFHFDSIVAEHGAGLTVISFQEFLEREAMTGHLIDPATGRPSFPPDNRTDWSGSFHNFETTSGGVSKSLWEWMRNVTYPLKWSYDECVVGIPKQRGPVDHMTDVYLQDVFAKEKNVYEEIAKRDGTQVWKARWKSIFGHPTPVDAPPADRLGELLANRKKLCLYDEDLQNARVVHALGESRTGYRLLIHFYAYLFFEDWRQDVWLKRFVRDHFRYIDEIQCAAARIVQAVRAKAREHGTADGKYDAFHIRRGDFQYKDMHLSAEEIYLNNAKAVMADGRTVFLATDERNKTFFAPIQEHYHVYFLDDFKDLITDVSPNYYGMLDQLVASRSEVFMGAFYSTFTGYINRMRGYHTRKEKAPEYEQGVINSYYYVPQNHQEFRNILRTYHGVRQAFWQQEFPVCWRDIDHDVDEATVLKR
jgi:GDP-fucose protein O-fucosyltransferase